MLLRQGHAVGENRVARLMAKAGIQSAHLRQHWKTTRQDRRNTAAPDLVDRKFTSQAPNRLWVADFSYILTMQGVLYLATVLDVFSRKIVGWQMSDRMTTDLVLSAFEMALWRRDVVREQLVHHSDKGSQLRFNRSLQRLEHGGGGWHDQVDGWSRGRDERRCGHREGRLSAVTWSVSSG